MKIRVVYSRSALLAATGNDVGVPRPAEPGVGTHIRVKKIANIEGTGIEVWEMKRVDPGSGTHKCAVLPTEGKLVDYSRRAACIRHARQGQVNRRSNEEGRLCVASGTTLDA